MPGKILGNMADWLKSFDFYAHPIGVNYRGSGSYPTGLGSLCSLATTVLVLINTANLITSFRDHSRQSEFFQQLKTDTKNMEPLVLEEQQIKFMLIDWDGTPSELGRWRAS